MRNGLHSECFVFFKIKLELFGPTKLAQDITLEDLSCEDIECVNHGYFQVLPVRDQAGRGILCLLLPFLKYDQPENAVRQLWVEYFVCRNAYTCFYLTPFCLFLVASELL
jgi:hypothetical protein